MWDLWGTDLNHKILKFFYLYTDIIIALRRNVGIRNQLLHSSVNNQQWNVFVATDTSIPLPVE
jgi:hypothetical protein